MITEDQIVFAPFRLDPMNAQLWRDNDEIILRPKTFEVLRYLAEHTGQLVTKAALLDAVWAELAVGDTMPAICVGELRKALCDKASMPQFIETIHRRGYRFIAKVVMAAPPDTTIMPPARPRTPAAIMVGREAELAQTRGWFANMLGGVRQVIFVSGEPGIGKTTFVRAFLDDVASTAHFARWLEARGRSIAARVRLAEIYNSFTEGFDTLPLQEAKTLLDELNKKPTRSRRR